MAPKHAETQDVTTPTTRALADAYAEALMAQSESEGQLNDLAAELRELVNLLDRSDDAEQLLTAALLSRAQRCELVRRVFHGRVSELLEAFLTVLARRNRLGLLRAAAERFEKQLERRRGKVELTVTTPVELDDAQRCRLIDDLRETFHAEPILTVRVDRELMGGATVQMGDAVYDASVSAQLRRFSRRLNERINSEGGPKA